MKKCPAFHRRDTRKSARSGVADQRFAGRPVMMQSRNAGLTPGIPLLLLGMLCQLGCSPAPQGTGRAVPPTEITAGATGEIENTYATYGQVEGGLAVVVWSDLEAVRSSSGTTSDEAEFLASHGDASGREIRWQSLVTSDRAGRVTINGQAFDLAEGRLFLATVASGKPIVKQLKYDVEQFEDQDLPESLRSWLETEPEIHSFFKHEAATSN